MQVVKSSQDSQSGESKRHNIGLSAALMGAGTLSSRILGFVRDALLASYFSRTVTDAWLVAFRLPNMFRRLLGEGALSVSFIPVFMGLLKGHELKNEAEKLAGAIFTMLLCLLIPLTALGIIFAEPVILALTPGEAFAGIPGKVELTIRLARIMFIYVLLVSLYAYYMAILNALKEFLLPAFAPVLWNIAMIASALLPLGAISESGEVLAWGVVVGGVLQVGVLVPALIKKNYFPRLSFDWRSPHISKVFRGLGPSLIGLGIMQITILVNTRFASYLPEGANSWIFWADRILELPLSLFAVSLGTALLPTLSSLWVEERKTEFLAVTNQGLRSVLCLAVPSAVGAYFLASPIIETLFMRGKFSEADLMGTSTVLEIYALSIMTYSVVRVLAPSFYAIKNTWYPAVCSAAGLALHLSLASWFIAEYGLRGLIISTVLSATLNMILLVIGFEKWMGRFEYKNFAVSFVKMGIAAGSMAGVLSLYPELRLLCAELLGVGFLHKAASLLVIIALGAAVYLGVAFLLRLEEVRPITRRIIAKILKRF